MCVSHNVLTQDSNFKKLRYVFVYERAIITTTLISKTLVTCCLGKKRPKNAFLKPTVICGKVIQKNNLCHPKEQ